MYAVVETSGHQFKIEQGETLRVDRIPQEVGAEVTFERVLMVGGSEVKVGNPTVESARVVGTVVQHGKGPKIVALNFKRRKGYHRRIGFRAQFTDVRIERIEV